jgi:hypothetical protein
MIDTMEIDARPAERLRVPARRRGQRIPLTAAVEVSGHDVSRACFNLNCTATHLNRNGATVHIGRDLPVDSVVVLNNHRGIRVSARIVSQTGLVRDLYAYGVEFLEAGKAGEFWGINFPPQHRK